MTLSFAAHWPMALRRAITVIASVAVAWLSTPIAASACSIIMEPYALPQHYYSITPRGRRLISRDEATVAVVKARLGAVGEDPPAVAWEGDGQWIVFDVIEILKGNLSGKDPVWLPVASDEFSASRKAETNRDLNFPFWDELYLQTATDPDFSIMTSCGPEPLPTVAPGQMYLVMSSTETIRIEHWSSDVLVPVASVDSPLVDAVRSYITRSRSPLRRSPRDYVSQMEGYAEVRVNECPLGRFEDEYRDLHDTRQSAIPGDNLAEIDAYGASVKETRAVDLVAYLAHIRPKVSCEAGRHYLALKRWDGEEPERNWLGERQGPLVFRYLPITQGTVRRDNIVSNIEITGPELIAVEDIKRWIRDANPDVETAPDLELLAIYAQDRPELR